MSKIVRIYRDACGILHAEDVDLKKDIKNATGSPCLSEYQVDKIVRKYEARGFEIVWDTSK